MVHLVTCKEALEVLSDLSLRELQILAAYLNLRHDENASRTLPSEVGGKGLKTISSLVDEAKTAGGGLCDILQLIPKLDMMEEALLRGQANIIFEAFDSTRIVPAPNSNKVDLQGSLMYKFVNDNGPYAYLRYWTMKGGRDRKRKKLRSIYLGRSFGAFLKMLTDYVESDLRKAINTAIVYAHWRSRINEVESMINTLGRVMNKPMFAILLEQEVQPVLNELNHESTCSPQRRAYVILETLLDLQQNIEPRRIRVFEEFKRRSDDASFVKDHELVEENLSDIKPMISWGKVERT